MLYGFLGDPAYCKTQHLVPPSLFPANGIRRQALSLGLGLSSI